MLGFAPLVSASAMMGSTDFRAGLDATRAAGFSLLELVVVISVAGLLAIAAIPRFVGTQGFSSRGFHDEALGVVRQAQKTAIAWRRPVFVCIASTGITAGTAAGCGTPLVHPATGGGLSTTAPTGVTLSTTPVTAEFSFDGIGRPNFAAALTIAFTSTIAGDPARQIVVEPETGYVHP
jgi:MSHA pilin protein MshC